MPNLRTALISAGSEDYGADSSSQGGKGPNTTNTLADFDMPFEIVAEHKETSCDDHIDNDGDKADRRG